jgi:hypothetical protein
MSGETAVSGDNLVYRYRPSLLGAPFELKLTGNDLEWVAGRRSGRVALRNIRHLRMSYRPANMQSHRFVTEVWADGAPKLQIVSSSWKSMVQQERLDKAYSAFIGELHRRIAQAGAPTLFEQGSNRLVYWLGVVVFAGVNLGLAVLIVRALQSDAKGGAAFIGVFLALFLWQGGDFLRRNRPGIYCPDALPPALMPKE